MVQERNSPRSAHILGEIPLASPPYRHRFPITRHVRVVDHVRSIDGVDGCHPVVQAERKVLVELIGAKFVRGRAEDGGVVIVIVIVVDGGGVGIDETVEGGWENHHRGGLGCEAWALCGLSLDGRSRGRQHWVV